MKIRKQSGFSLVELMVTMVIFVLVIAAVSNIFTGLLTQFKQQSKIAETNIEGIVGLQMLRADIEQAGYGLPFDIGTADYDEAVNDGTTTQDETAFNDAGATDAPPRAVLTATLAAGANGLPNTYQSDALVIKATNVSINGAGQRWTYVSNSGAAATTTVHTWADDAGVLITDENLRPNAVDNTRTDRIIVLRPSLGSTQRILLNNGAAAFFTDFDTVAAAIPASLVPTVDSYETFLIYGVTTDNDPRMPFNRADFYVRQPAAGMPTHCEPSTGILYKAVVNNTSGGGADGQLTEYPLLDCVVAMKVVLARDTNSDGLSDSFVTAWPVGTTAADIRSQLKEVRVYILAHEGQRDSTYTSPVTMTLTDPNFGALLVYPVPDLNYRWKIYSMIIKPYNLR